MNLKTFNSLPPDLQKVVLDVGRELQQMVSLSTTAEYMMSLDTVDLSGVKRTRFSKEEMDVAVKECKVVEEAWLNMDGPWKAKRPKLLSAAKAAVAKYRGFTGK
jgi:TRAP-type C4-dicarboxylate transport system substrate-binding protein